MLLSDFLAEWHSDSDRVLVHTSGSTGEPKPLWVEKRRMEASARITCRFLGLQPGDRALLCMPLDYIAGKMMVVRALTWGLRLVSVPPSAHPLEEVSEPIQFAAMVPMQVYSTLQVAAERERLSQIDHLIIGGGAIDDELAQALRQMPHHVWSTYGMTETLSHIALRRLNGPDADEWYTPLPMVSVSVDADDCLVIDAPQVCPTVLKTHDIAEMSADGRFRIMGRKDNVICSGGVKIQAEQVEQRLRQHTAVPLLVTKCRHKKFGEAVVLLTESDDVEGLSHLCQQVLPRYWQPKYVLAVSRLPMTATGKPARREAELMAAQLLSR